MNLLYTLTAYPPSIGGAQLYTHMLARQMQKRHDVQVVTQWDTNRTDWLLGTTLLAPRNRREYILDGVPVHRIGLSLREKLQVSPYVLLYYPLMAICLPPIAGTLERHLQSYAVQSDLVHNVRIGREALSYASYYVARRQGIPFVFTPVHHPRWRGWRYRAYIKLYAMADLVIALTNMERKTLISLGVPEERIAVTGMGPILASRAFPERFKRNHSIDGPMVLFLGQHYPYKGYHELLRATHWVWQKMPEAHFAFVGPAVGQSEQYFEGQEDRRIHRLGAVDLQEKTDALAACDVLCVPSSQESFGGVYTEAWSLGKPVIGCDIPAVAEVITDGVDGYLVEQEPLQIAQLICELLLHPAEAQAMGRAGQRKVERRYTWQELAERTMKAYKRVIQT